MMEQMAALSPVGQALAGGIFTWGITALGAAAVFAFRRTTRPMMGAMLGFAAGVMLAASFWSLLAPAIEMSGSGALPPWFAPAVGFVAGAISLRLIDRLLPHLQIGASHAEGPATSWRRSILLVLAITIHNIPEGLAVGVAFGAVGAGLPHSTLAAAMTLALGIGIQNFPEGFAVAAALRHQGLSRLRSFWYGQLSGIVEPMAAVAGAAAVVLAKPLLPYAMGFAAGAMVFVVSEEVIPESQRHGNAHIATAGTIFGFTLMMILDVALG